MSTARDHFTRFVDVLAEAIDDHAVTSEELASRLYLSRYHLDRIISSVAGEPPDRFRRRILLERAAYRLVATRRTILDILRLPAETKVTSMDLVVKMVEHHIWLTGEMIACAARVTEEQLDEPIVLTFAAHRRTLTVLALARHGITDLGWGDPMQWVAEPAR